MGTGSDIRPKLVLYVSPNSTALSPLFMTTQRIHAVCRGYAGASRWLLIACLVGAALEREKQDAQNNCCWCPKL